MDHEKNDAAHIRDEMFGQRGVLIEDRVGMHGVIVLEKYTAPSFELMQRPTALMVMARQLDLLTDLREIPGEKLDDGSILLDNGTYIPRAHLDWLVQLAPLPKGVTGENLADELESYLTRREVSPNLITQSGDQMYGERAWGIVGAPAVGNGMKLGSGSTAPAKTGAGAALVTYKAGSNKLFDGGYPASSLNGASRQIQLKVSWLAGVINGTPLTEAAIVNDAAVDATSTAANTYSRALFGPDTLGVLDTLALTWNHLLLGA